MLTSASEPLPQIGSFCRKPERRPLFSATTARLLAQTEDRVMQLEWKLYLADVHGVRL